MSRRLARGLAQTLCGGAAVATVSLVRNVLIARVMGAAAFGLWNVCLVAQRIAAESHLGALSAVAVRSPLARGEGDEAAAARVERVGATLALILGGVAGVVAGAALRVIGGPPLATAGVALAVCVLLQQQFAAAATILRARLRFGGLAVGQGVFAVVYVAGLVLLLPDYYVTGALAAAALALVAALAGVWLHSRAAAPAPARLHAAETRALIRRGLPVYLVQLTLVLLLQTDRVVVGAALGQEALGHYGVLVIAGTGLLFVPDAFSAVLWPFASERFGRLRSDPGALSSLAAGSVRHLSLLLLGLLPLTLAAADALVAHVLPQYAPALPALRIYVAGLFPLALSLPLRNLLVTAGAERPLLRLQVALLAAEAGLATTAALTGFGIRGVALVTAIVSATLYAAVLALSARRNVLAPHAAASAAAWSAVALALALGADALLNTAAPREDTLTGAAVRVGLAAAFAACALMGVVIRTRDRNESV